MSDQARLTSAGSFRPRARMGHHCVTLDDGHRVGVSVGGCGVPLVLQHGVAMNRRSYLRLLSRLAASGFLVVALDAAGHGDTIGLPEPRTFSGMSALTLRTLDALGIRQAVFLGHSMGGRMAIELAATRPDRVLAAVLVDAAAGTTFDQKALRAHTAPHTIAWGLAAAVCDVVLEQRTLRGWAHVRYAQLVGRAVWHAARHPAEPLWAIRAIAAASDSSAHLRALAAHDIPTFVVHARNDLIVPWQSALDMARLTQGALYEVPNASHGWILADPDRGANVVTDLLDNELIHIFNRAQHTQDRTARTPAGWADSLLTPDASVRRMVAAEHMSTDSSPLPRPAPASGGVAAEGAAVANNK